MFKLDLEVGEILGSGLGLVVELEDAHQTTGATHGDDAVLLLVEVEQVVTHEHVGLDVAGTGQTGLLVNGSEGLQGTALQRRLNNGSQGDSQAHTVVGTQGGVVGANPFAIDDGLDGVGVEVVGRAGTFLGDHIHVTLQHDALALLVARSGGPEDGHVAGLVDLILQIVLLGEVHEPCADLV